MQLLAARNYEESRKLGPFKTGAAYGVFHESTAFPETPQEALKIHKDDGLIL